MTCACRIVYHELFERRGFTAMRRTWNRYALFRDTLSLSPLAGIVPITEAPAAAENDVMTVHTPEYLDLIQTLDLSGKGRLDGSTPAWTGMYARAERVFGGSLHGADLVAGGTALHVFQPAGGQHHAHAGRGGGFCVFNDVVGAVRRFQLRGLQRIAVVDLDGHHGDGTQSLLYRDETLYVSMHQFGDRTYPGTGTADEVGEAAGRATTLNVPLRKGTGGSAYLSVLESTVLPLIRAYRPDALIVQFGTDGHHADPLLRLRLTTADYASIARAIHQVAHEVCGGKMLVVGGGGYAPEYVVRCWLLLLAELAGLPLPEAHPAAPGWLSDSAETGAEESGYEALAAAARARLLVFPRYGLTA